MNETILNGLVDNPTAEQQRQQLLYFEELKSSEIGWKYCIHAFSQGSSYNSKELVQFFCLQVIEAYLKSRYGTDNLESKASLREFLSQGPRMLTLSDSTFIRNKFAQLVALTFVQDFPQCWPTFFNDLLQSLQLGDIAVDHYLRVLKAIDTEVADKDIVRNNLETQRNNNLKDAMRESVVLNLVNSWYQILTTFEGRNPMLAVLCLQIIGAYISWIDINLVANDKFVPVLVKELQEPALRETAADCIGDIISKGMEPLNKTKLIESFSAVLSSAGVWAVVTQPDADSDYVAKLGKILNGMGVGLIDAYHKIVKSNNSKDNESSLAILQAIQSKTDLLLQFLGNIYDETSLSVFDFMREYLHLLKSKSIPSEVDQTFLDKGIEVVCLKFRYDEDYDFDREGEDEAEFQEYRKQLKVIFDNIALIDKERVVRRVHTTASQAFRKCQEISFQDVELALYLTYILGDTVPSAGVCQFSHDLEKSSPLQILLIILSESDVHLHSHSAVILQYFEVVARYEKFYSVHSDHIVRVLAAFVGPNGLFHPSMRVRSRGAYLFSRFVKSIRSHITPAYTKEILQSIQALLPISESPENAEERVLSDDDQLYLYEAVGTVILAGESTQEKRTAFMQQAIAPLIETCRRLTTQLTNEKQPNNRERIVLGIVQTISVTGRLSKAFTAQETMKSCGCVQIYLDALHAFLQTIDVINGSEQILVQSAVRQYLHRLVVCLEDEVLPYIPVASQSLLRNCDCRSIQEYIPLINQVVTKFKLSWLFQKEVTPFLQQIFAPMVQSIFTNLALPMEANDHQAIRERQVLQRQYFHFIATIVTNNLTDVLPSQNPELLQQVMQSIIQGSIEFPDPVAQKSCFMILKKLVEIWGDQTGPEGFIEFMYKSIVPACFLAPTKPTFDLSDAQTLLVLNETAACLKNILEKRKEEFVIYLRVHYLPSLEMTNEKIESYIAALQCSHRDFKSFLKEFFRNGKS